jgi:thioredoxin-related protein
MKPTTGRIRRSVEIAANVAIILVAIFIVGNFVSSRFRPKQTLTSPPVGSTVSLSGVDWEKNGTTLLMVLQEGCRYCDESAPFYRRLHDQRSGQQPRMVAVIPGEKAETVRYLSDHGVLADDVINTSLDKIKVTATPTLLLVDQSGQVKGSWVGKLDENREKEVTQQVLNRH